MSLEAPETQPTELEVENVYESSYWAFDFFIEHFQRREKEESYEPGERGIYSARVESKDQEIRWEIRREGNSTWIRAYTVLEGAPLGEEEMDAVTDYWEGYLDTATRDRIEKVNTRAKRTLGIE